MNNSIPMQKETYDKLIRDLSHLKKVERVEIIEAVQDAREQGDLKENAEYHAAREKQSQIEDKIAEIEDKLSRAQVIEHDTAGADKVLFGATVKVKNVDTNKEIEYQLVSPDAVDILSGKISNNSPIGRALLGAKRGEIIEAQIPRGLLKLEILDYK
ncbi:MAG: transcription elongation factor GreA [Fibrobacterales bacterium]